MKRLLLVGLAFLLSASFAQAQTLPVQTLPAGPPGCAAAPPACAAAPPACATPPACASILDCGQAPPPNTTRVWGGTEYLLWWMKGTDLQPLVTTSSAAVTIFDIFGEQPFPGTYGFPTTGVLFGDGRYDEDARSGGRLYAGFWFDCGQTLGMESSYFTLFSQGTRFSASSAGSPLLARPFIDLDGTEQASPLAFPTFLVPPPFIDPPDSVSISQSGGIAIRTYARLQGFEQNMLFNIARDSCLTVNLLGGFRYFQLDDGIDIATVFNGQQNISVPGLNATITHYEQSYEQFKARNQFFGGQFGCRAEWHNGPLFVNVMSKLALGGMQETVTISGRTYSSSTVTGLVVPPDEPTTIQSSSQGALLAQRSLLGQHTRDRFALIGELGGNVGYEFCAHLRCSVGYTFLYCNEVVRGGEQITRVSNGFVGSTDPEALPRFVFRSTDFWAQGANFNLELRY